MSETDSETSLPSLTLDNPVSFEHGNESQEIPDSGSEENLFIHLFMHQSLSKSPDFSLFSRLESKLSLAHFLG